LRKISEVKTPVADYDFYLPEELIAQYPAKERGKSRLLVMDRKSGGLSDHTFADITAMIDDDCFMVVNTTRVMKARLYGKKTTGGVVELLILEKLDEYTCLALTKGNVKQGIVLNFPLGHAVIESLNDDSTRTIRFVDITVTEMMNRYGHIPLPPYIRRDDTDDDVSRYQTVYSAEEASVAAPTAGLHFTEEILGKIRAKGVKVLELTLNIGIGTFRPVKADYLEDHEMHTEKYYISEDTAAEINTLKAEGKKLLAVGTTAVRALEAASSEGWVAGGYGETDLFIKPGYKFRTVDRMITNFHLPKSTLLVLVTMFAGYDSTMNAYKHAVESGYRFFSYGDAMYIR